MIDDEDFEPELRRMGGPGSPRDRKYLHQLIAGAARAGSGRPRSGRAFSGARIGRGAAVAQLMGSRGLPVRRAMVKVSYVRLSGRGAARACAHLRYIQRDGTAREGAPGELYSACEDRSDGKAFLERSAGDRHQFRFIVSAEDGSEYGDLKPLIRRVMEKVEEDLGTRLDWVAADHHDTLHPHTHILLRGQDELGRDLVIARHYLSRGLRERVAEQVTLDLGPPTAREVRQRQIREVGAERLTSIDRRLLRAMDGDRCVAPGAGSGRPLQAGRLRKLARLGLAEPLGGGRWRLAEGLEERLRQLGERHDIVRAMQRELAARGVERRAADRVHFSRLADGRAVVGRLVARGLSDELRDRHYLIVDALDGRTHYVDIGRGEGVEPMPEGAIVRLSARRSDGPREADRIAAANGGRSSEDRHRSVEPGRAGAAPVRVELLSSHSLDRLVDAGAATWLDRELLSDRPEPVRDSGFGAEVLAAKAARRSWLAQQGLIEERGGSAAVRPDLLVLLRRRELAEAGGRLASEFGLPARGAELGEQVGGILLRRIDLASGRFGLVQGTGELVLVPWRRGLEHRLGRSLSGRVGSAGFSWSAGKSRSIGIE